MENLPFFTMDDFDFNNSYVYLRIDINSPINPITGEIMDNSRLKSYAKTIEELSRSKLVITAHQGRPGENDFISLNNHARFLSNILNRDIEFIDSLFGHDVRDSIDKMKPGDIIMLENTRFYSEEISINPDKFDIMENTNIIRNLSRFFNYYIIDAFGTIHRPQTSLIGFKNSGPMIAGRLMEYEIKMINQFKYSDLRPKIAILGGSKISDAIKVSKSFFDNNIVDYIIYGGVVANILVWAKGYNIGKKNRDFIINNNKNYKNIMEISRYILEKYSNKIILPEDFILNPSGRHININENIPDDELLADIGMDSILKFEEYIKDAKNIFINGPMGMYEISPYSLGTREILNSVAMNGGMKLIGGGHTLNALNKFELSKYMNYISTGGGALINYLSGDSIPVIDALIENKKIFEGVKHGR